ncbi:MAG: prevent-host-death protein [Dysgonamonadaceae bacterium]|jgi:hypothetical protein|nr:prevent-host-death protein [Dysgonamonadaceae bacterium]
MLVISTRELTQNQKKYFEEVDTQRVIIKRKNRFFQLVDLGESIPEIDDTYMTKEEMYAKIDRGIEDYKQGNVKTLSSKEEIRNFLELL